MRVGDAVAMRSAEHLHIAVEGCVGVGKTTLATKLAQLRGARLVLEDFEKNPFLPKFYGDPKRYVLETEMQFLLLHYHQLRGLREDGAREAITDFTFFKDSVFADVNFVNPAEAEMFGRVYKFLLGRLDAPQLIIYLKGSDDLILERIRKRNRSMEVEVDASYFRRLRRAYDDFFLNSELQVHVIEADTFECLHDTAALRTVSKAIDSLLAQEAFR